LRPDRRASAAPEEAARQQPEPNRIILFSLLYN
jgi:hypothetical protein